MLGESWVGLTGIRGPFIPEALPVPPPPGRSMLLSSLPETFLLNINLFWNRFGYEEL
jgi:hypothetical protein